MNKDLSIALDRSKALEILYQQYTCINNKISSAKKKHLKESRRKYIHNF